ncbi:ATP-dependent Clp protease adapter ClpS [SAR86 cluster bacterium]|mgnify:FL=1|jgi:ATP-dependent Clp protease adaptor protein ClpS|nr:ATP-dependent Clp protease adapter ClpS [SAR86 cluster bacterium]|tara:strand:+ start:255 stop:605 length:351 start_codon:yes stop_codon:yes gene_type:complete
MTRELLQNNSQSDPEDNSSVLVKPSEPILKRPPLYHVVLLNDDYTPMEFVIYILQSFFGYDKEKSTEIMLAVHTKGKGICGVFTKEVAETKSSHINNFAQQNEHPLISEIEPAEDE